MKYAIMIFNYAEDEQVFLGIKETIEVKDTIKKGIEELVEKNPDIIDLLEDVSVYVMAEDFSGVIEDINKMFTLNEFFSSNKKSCYFILDDICSISKVKVNI